MKTSSTPGVRAALGEEAPRRVEHRRDRRLVVAAEDALVAVADDPVLDDRLDRRDRRHGVEVGAEEERLAVGGRLERDVEVAHRRADLAAGAVLVGPQAAIAEVVEHPVGDGALLAGGARESGELEEQLEDVGGHGRPW